MSVVVEGDISVESGELEGPIGDGHDLGRVEDEAHIVEGGSNVSPARDVAFAILVLECGF